LPIGNLTSQILANIYLNEFDQFALHSLKPRAFVRYGDDFVLWYQNEDEAHEAQVIGGQFLADYLGMTVNLKHDRVQPASHKLAYLGVDLWPKGKRLQVRTTQRINQRLELRNVASYRALVKQHQPRRYAEQFAWNVVDLIDEE